MEVLITSIFSYCDNNGVVVPGHYAGTMALQSKGKLVTKAIQTLLSFWSSQLYVDENLLLERGLHQLISSVVIVFQNKHGLVVVLKNDQSG